MKKTVKFIGALLLTTLYCLAIGVVTQSLASYNVEEISTAKEVQFSYNASNNFFTQTSQTENIVDIPSNNSNFPSTLKDIFKNFIASNTSASQHSILSLNSNYYSTYINFLVQFKKLKLIFPFHYFL
ncbi:MAG: hypothetical protein ABJD66_02000 [Cellulophaga sp.]|uniref:hypothetical protein n=1 Tax=unclassified Cellulophaga TaxID=2634405 RepID=UPI000C2CD136|nr:MULTISPECIES: hypothetical protein [unclassified Cellulophaga]MDO6490687.1 hypothetical protein [Cellulophaga sp. 2_MG-2023]MDO6494119.1 hypothetical protein [Cellulophaga sp. 3_MG-2023]PKB45051.1 hypothetical protein AX016_3287 [Cellulophaga sp. RHA19]